MVPIYIINIYILFIINTSPPFLPLLGTFLSASPESVVCHVCHVCHSGKWVSQK
jgi:hypothetical protein